MAVNIALMTGRIKFCRFPQNDYIVKSIFYHAYRFSAVSDPHKRRGAPR